MCIKIHDKLKHTYINKLCYIIRLFVGSKNGFLIVQYLAQIIINISDTCRVATNTLL